MGEFSKHEAMHTAWFLADCVDRGLVEHPAVAGTPALLELASRASDALNELYQALGAETSGEGTTMKAEIEMPRYRSHKEVHALKIAGVSTAKLGTVTLDFADQGFAPIDVEPEVVSRYMPAPGDYLIVYADGYKSISPAKAFEDGYTRV